MTAREVIDEPREAHTPAARIIEQLRDHVTVSQGLVRQKVERPSQGTPARDDFELSGSSPAGKLLGEQFLAHLNAANFSLLSCLDSMVLHLSQTQVNLVPMLLMARSSLEYAATVAWLLDQKEDAKTRQARAAASLFASLDQTIRDMGPGEQTVQPYRDAREKIIELLGEAQGEVQWWCDGGKADQVRYVTFNNVKVSTKANYTQRLDEYMGPQHSYGILSGVVHGTPFVVGAIRSDVPSMLRAVATSMLRAVEVWSSATYAWAGIAPTTIVNRKDVEELEMSATAYHERRGHPLVPPGT